MTDKQITDMNKTEDTNQTAADKEIYPNLGYDFWADLLKLPSCKTIGVCDDCGRCER